MSEYTFGYDQPGEEPDLSEAENQPKGPKWFREGLAELSGQVKELRAENAALKATQVKTELEDALKAKGYAPAAAGLFTGKPAELDDWLTANGGALAKLPGEGQEQGTEQAPTGPPASVVPADGQEQMRRMQEQGTQGVAPPQGSDKELSAAIAACKSEEEFDQLMKSHGSQHDWA